LNQKSRLKNGGFFDSTGTGMELVKSMQISKEYEFNLP
jgi:hypothetical protein